MELHVQQYYQYKRIRNIYRKTKKKVNTRLFCGENVKDQRTTNYQRSEE